ncbi:RNase P subunit p30 family protein [Halosegnis marinus]|uniref:Ribonuclease P protein component 3 n=1 Tax=Halosegnis marinus TaxID=3034023 RepID=A0ABD5ZKZ9_9EURY|nr:RNase P subunit p30 family protein [Halosegnis sp. DT85]
MYEGVHAHPDGDATVARHALTAAEYGYEGVVVRNHGDRQADYDRAAVADEYDVDVVDAIELRTDDRSQLASLVKRYREERTLVAVHGGDDATNRFACESERVDVLAHPTRDDGGFNHVLAKAAKRNGVRIEFDFGAVLRDDGGSRVRTLAALRKLREVVGYYDAPYVVSANPASHLELRAPRELVALAERAGFDPEWTREGLREWGRVAARNREVASDSFIEPGVRTEDDETDR